MSIQVALQLERSGFSLQLAEEFPSQGVTGIIGPSGCGKTTLLRAIAGLDRHSNARVSVGETTWQSAEHWLPIHQRPLGYVFQEPSLFSHLNVEGNIRYGWKRRHNAAPDLLSQAIDGLGVAHLLPRWPGSLSGGERQRVAIARALASGPQLLLMDEPLAALDAQAREELLPWLDALHGNLQIPLLYVSHSLDEIARLADTLLLMADGRALAHGPIQPLLARLDLPLAHRPEAESLIHAQVSAHDRAYHLTALRFGGEQAWVREQPLAVNDRVRLRIAARDVSLTLDRPRRSSILNVFRATVIEIGTGDGAQAMVALEVGTQPLLARVTKKSIDELGIRPGQQLYAQAKSVAVLN